VKCIFFLLTFLLVQNLYAQVDTAQLGRIFARALDLTEAQTDSINYYADFIRQASMKGKYPEGDVMSLRLYGYYYENKGEYEKAIDYYLQSLDAARKLKNMEFEAAALTNLAGYQIHYGTSQNNMSQTVQITNPTVTSYVITNLAAGTWYFGVAAYISSGMVGNLSNVGQKTIQ